MKTLSGLAAALLLLCISAPATAQSSTPRTFAVSLMGGLGGAIDEGDAGYDNTRFQIGLSVQTEANSKVAVRIGSYDFGSGESLGDAFEPKLDYATIGGEYSFNDGTYTSGVFVGLGAYRLEATEAFTGADISTTRVGLTAGATGEFDVTQRLSLVGELSAHILPSGEAQFFAGGLVGLQFYIR